MCLIVEVEFEQHAVYYAGESFRCQLNFLNGIYDAKQVDIQSGETLKPIRGLYNRSRPSSFYVKPIVDLEKDSTTTATSSQPQHLDGASKSKRSSTACTYCHERPELVQWASIQLLGYFTVDKVLVKEEHFYSLLGSSSGKMGQRKPSSSTTALPNALESVSTDRTVFPLFSTDPVILFANIEFSYGQKRSCKFYFTQKTR
jgi:hypothetical protein